MIEADQLSYSYGKIRAVESVSFRAATGGILALLGPNGAGKTTTLRMLTGFLRPDSGRALVRGDDVWSGGDGLRQSFGYLPERAPLYGEMTVVEFLRFCGRVRGLDRSRMRAALDRVCGICHLETVWNQTIDSLSKGYRRRTGLAQALLHDPSCIILDEPADGLDPNQKRELRAVLTAIKDDKAILLSTHDLSEVEAVADQVVILRGGEVVAHGAPEELVRAQSGANTLEDVFVKVTKGESA